MSWIVTIVVGGIVGWLGSIIMKTNAQMGIIANVIVGIIGSSLGFWLAGLIGVAAYGAIAQWAVAVLGAVALIFILKAVGIFK
ncbi:MAG TPA: GlsB/YeaQ/YmgE family stress response membrane protein [Candidatus Polarisedimenticolia bacterium]|nr:GlsB/YeaQ/YmgE family stress response membrane protein [Candidatus Polarisedimenticolia bacterium]